MDKVSDFFKDLKERISSPLISSFIVSWVVFNWKIVVALLKFEVKGFSLKDYSSYIDYISTLINKNDCFWHPLWVGLFYTLIYPFARNGIQIADAWFKAWGNQYKLRASKSNMVSIEKYIQLREIYKERSNLLQSVLEEESKTIQKNELLVNENSELKNRVNQKDKELTLQNEQLLNLHNDNVTLSSKINSLEIQLSKLNTIKENEKDRLLVESLNGFWIVTRFVKNFSEKQFAKEKLRIQDGKVFLIDDMGIEINFYIITEYQYRQISNNLHIVTNRSTRDHVNITFTLIPDDDFKVLTGKESNNPITTVTFTKVSTLEELISL